MPAAYESGVGFLTVSRPDKRNALTDAMWRVGTRCNQLAGRRAERARRHPVEEPAAATFRPAPISASSPPCERTPARRAPTRQATRPRSLRCAIARCRLSRRCGASASAADFGLAAAADLRLADDTARFAIPAARLGLAYPVDAVQDLVRALGDQRARHALFSAREFPASEAMETGCLLKLCQPEALDAEVTTLAQAIAAAAPLSVRASKAAIAAQSSALTDGMTNAATHADATFDSDDYAEGRTAFMEKRPPRFIGK
jgi:enoyl-CoA hydratase/carnithine racemase